jgi:iron complex transport system substrate-binding protein
MPRSVDPSPPGGPSVARHRVARRACALALLLAAVACAPAVDPAAAPQPLGTAHLERPPRRIVPSTARALEFAAALVGPERLAGLPEQGFEYAVLDEDEPRFAALPRFYAYLAEPVLALEPDLVLGDPWQPGDTSQRLVEAGVAVVVLPETTGWRDAADVLLGVGRLVGEEDRARETVGRLEQRVAALELEAPRRAGLRALPYSNFGSQGFSAGSGTTLDAALRLAGLINAASAAGRVGHGPIGFEEVLVIDPDVIVVSAPLHTDAGHAGDRGGASESILLAEPALASLRAVRERRIVSLSPGLYASASHRVVDAAEALAVEVDALLGRLAASTQPEQR